jgi:hypothetical protein
VAVAVLLMMPVVLMRTVHVGTEVWAELGVVAVVWLLVRWESTRAHTLLVAVGVTVGVLTWFRPAYQLLIAVLAVLVAVRAGAGRWRSVVALVTPTVVIVGSLVVTNAVRFDTPGVDRLLPYHLSQKTAMFVERLPDEEEPVRSILVDRRDELLVEDPEHSPASFLFDSRGEIEEVTGRHGAALDREVWRLDLLLIRENPLSYAQSVQQAGLNYVQVDAQAAGHGGHPTISWLWSAVHAGLVALFVGVAILVPGVALARGMERRVGLVLGLCWLVVLYNAGVTVLVVMGEARIRTPTDPLLVLILVGSLSWLRRQYADEGGARTPLPHR